MSKHAHRAAANPTPVATNHEDRFGLDRLVFFTDAVIAIAITLLVLDIKVPDLPANISNEQLVAALVGELPKFFGFVTSFWVIAIYWVAHHRIFRHIVRYDQRLIQLSLLYMFFIAFVPFPTALLNAYAGRAIVVELYAGTMVLIGLTRLAITYHAAHHQRLVAPDYPWDKARVSLQRGLVPPLVFLLSMLIAPFNGDLAMDSWIALLILYIFIAPFREGTE